MDEVVTVSSAYDNAVLFLQTANDYLTEWGILDEDGNAAYLLPTEASPAWLFAMSIGHIYSLWQARLRDAVNVFSVDACTDAQVLNLAQIAGITRDTGTPSYVVVTITATSSSACSIAEGYVFTTEDGVRWLLTSDVSLVAGASGSYTLISETNGAYAVVSGQTFTPVAAITGLSAITASAASVQGQGYQTIYELRREITEQGGSANPLEKAKAAILELTGILSCKIYFNDSLDTTMTLPGGQTVAPRTALITIYGTDADGLIAKTFLTYCDVPATGAYSSTYTTTSGQVITVGYDKAVLATLQCKVYVEAGSTQSGYEQYLREAIIAASGSLAVGEDYTSQYISQNYTKDFAYATVLGVQLYNGTSWGFTTAVNWNVLGQFTTASITIEEV